MALRCRLWEPHNLGGRRAKNRNHTHPVIVRRLQRRSYGARPDIAENYIAGRSANCIDDGERRYA